MYISEGVLTARYAVLCDSRVCNICGKHTWLSERSIKLQVSFAKEPYERDNILHACTHAESMHGCQKDF